MPLPFSRLFRRLYSRVTFNRMTTWFFIFSILHCFIQGIIQSFLFSIDTEYNSILSSITTMSNIPSRNTTYLEGSPGKWHLRMCNHIPYGHDPIPCIDIFRSGVDDHNDLSAVARQVLDLNDNLVASPTPDKATSGNSTGVIVSSDSVHVSLSLQCIQTLVYSEQIMRNSKREDLAFVFLQFWLVGISVFALMTDSVPHTLTVLVTRCLITAWSAYAIWKTNYTKTQFTDIIFKSGTPCSFNINPMYFQFRITYQIPDLILNVTALLIATYLSFKLLRDYNEQSLKYVGGPKHVNRINKFFLALLACLQLECFVVMGAGGLWIDILVNTPIAKISTHTVLYKGLFVFTTVLLLPWIVMGWYSIRREMRRVMIGFLGIAFFLLTSWSIMFDSQVYRWSFMQFPFLGCFTVASLTLIIATIVLGVICRLNFGKGLKEYLYVNEVLANSDFAPEVFKHDEENSSLDFKFEEKDEKFYADPTVPKSILPKPRLAHLSSPPPPYQVPYNVPF